MDKRLFNYHNELHYDRLTYSDNKQRHFSLSVSHTCGVRPSPGSVAGIEGITICHGCNGLICEVQSEVEETVEHRAYNTEVQTQIEKIT
jgi:hypothetical protein